MFKRSLITLTMFGLLAAGSVAFSQDNSGGSQQPAQQNEAPGHGHGPRHFDPQKRAEMLSKQLNLSSDQQAKVLDVLKSEQSQMETLRSDTSTAPEDRRSKMMEIHKTSSDQIRALLNSDQQKKWDEMQARRQQWQGQQKPPDSSEQK
jgi:periplasmic protein CpxP/Spy